MKRSLSKCLSSLCEDPDCAVRDPVRCFEENVVSVEERAVLLAEDICRVLAIISYPL